MKLLSVPLRKHPVTALVTWLLVTFLVLFPKGGIKLWGSLPVTWGYLVIALSFVPVVMLRLLAVPLRFKIKVLAAVGSLLPFQVLFVYSYFRNGVGVAAYAFSTFVAFFVLPVVFLLLYPAFSHLVDGRRLAHHLRFCILAAAVYGIFLFVWHPLTGHFIEIPYLTVNANDFGQIEATKHIDRGFFLKLISTYNNGNVYGAATLILLPMYGVLEKKLWKRNTLKLALVLTLSRTIWAGLLVLQLLPIVSAAARAALSFPRVVLGPVFKRGMFFVATLALVFVGLALSSQNLAYLFDRQLGGRAESLNVFISPSFLPSVPLSGFTEILYASALANYGVLGFLSIVLIFVFPLFLFLANQQIVGSPLRMAALEGLILYMIVSCVDGATNLIPVMAFYWFAYMVFLEGWPGGLEVLSLAEVAKQEARCLNGPNVPVGIAGAQAPSEANDFV